MKKSESLELKHHKDFHRLNLTKLEVKTRNVFMMLCFELMEKGQEKITYTLKQLLETSNWKGKITKQGKINFIIDSFKRLSEIAVFEENPDKISFINLFSELSFDKKTEEATFSINPKFKNLLNDVQKPFTIQKLIEYKSLKSGYSQLMYSLLKEWDGAKEKEWEIEEFRRLLGVPEDYETTNFNKRVLKPIMSELEPIFKGLKITKDNRGTKKTQAIKFTWGIEAKKVPKIKIDKTIKTTKTKTQAELLEQMKANEKAKEKIKETEEYNLKQEEERANITNEDRKKGLEKAKEEFEKELRGDTENIEQSIKEMQELGATKTTIRLMNADMKRIIKLNTMKTPTEIEIFKTALGVLKEIKDPFNATMSETDLKVIREQAKKYKIKLDW